jgi:hypothetical protein
MPRWKAELENTSVPGGALALQVRPRIVRTSVTFDSTTRRPQVITWHTSVIAIREAEVMPSGSSGPGFIGRPALGRVIPPWVPTRNARLVDYSLTNITPGVPQRAGVTPAGTQVGGPSFSQQLSLPTSGSPVHKIYHFRAHYPEESPLIIASAGTHDYSTDGDIVPQAAGVLYCGSARSSTEQTLTGNIVFEEL